jgi:hypothetical protein
VQVADGWPIRLSPTIKPTGDAVHMHSYPHSASLGRTSRRKHPSRHGQQRGGRIRPTKDATSGASDTVRVRTIAESRGPVPDGGQRSRVLRTAGVRRTPTKAPLRLFVVRLCRPPPRRRRRRTAAPPSRDLQHAPVLVAVCWARRPRRGPRPCACLRPCRTRLCRRARRRRPRRRRHRRPALGPR